MSNENTRLVTPKGRLIFDRNLFEADEKKGKFSAAMLIPAGENFDALLALCMEKANEKWPKGLPAGMKLPVKDTDPNKHEEHPHMAGMKILNAGTKFNVGVIDTNHAPVLREDIKAGDDVRFSVSAWCYDVDGNRGVALNLHAVLKEGNNEAFTAKASASDMFAGFTSGEATQGAPAAEGNFDSFGF